jgi:hypothetical protein
VLTTEADSSSWPTWDGGLRRCCSSGPKLVRDCLNLAVEVVRLKGIRTFDVREGGRLTPAAVEKLSVGGHAVTVMRLRVFRDLQKALGKTEGRASAHLAHRARNPFASSSGVSGLPGLEGPADHLRCSVAVLSGLVMT